MLQSEMEVVREECERRMLAFGQDEKRGEARHYSQTEEWYCEVCVHVYVSVCS